MRMQHLFAPFLNRGLHRSILTCVLALCLMLPIGAQAQSFGLIRDTEIEHTLRAYADPIFKSAGLVPSSINIYIVQDDSINAFVTGGSNVFIHTGLILRTSEPGMLIGVIAHETGHISGGHLVRTNEAMEKARLQMMMGYLLGAAAVAGGAGDAGAAIMNAGQHAATRGLISHTRANEQAADQAALRFLDANQISAQGMMQMFEVLRQQENRQIGNPDPYTMTHPLSRERIMHMRNHVAQSSIPVGQVPTRFNAM
ncbi:MAG: M48 family metallopeptidase, partial [Rickettsiales bacterium]